jgi:hypothetical protein
MDVLINELNKLRRLANHIDRKIRKYDIDATSMKKEIDDYILKVRKNREVMEAYNAGEPME